METDPVIEEDSAVIIRIAVPADVKFIYPILEEMERSARERGTGIARRTPQSLCTKIYEGKAVIALTRKTALTSKSAPIHESDLAGEPARQIHEMTDHEQQWVGFSYIEPWSDGAFVSNSGLIVNPAFRRSGVATAIKQCIFELSRSRYPEAKIFSITTGAAVLALNHQLGFRPVTYAEITQDARFWDQCRSCVNHAILEGQERKRCLCTAMLFNPKGIKHPERVGANFQFDKMN